MIDLSPRKLLIAVTACLALLAASVVPAAAVPKPQPKVVPNWSGNALLSASTHTVNYVPIFPSPPMTSTLQAYTNTDVGPSPYYIQTWDLTTGALLSQCGTGTTCSAVVTQSTSTTHRYLETIASYATAYPPANIQATSLVNYITWNYRGTAPYFNAGIVIAQQSVPPYAFILTGTSNVDVGPTIYYIEVFDTTTGNLAGSCGSGTSCQFTYAAGFNDQFATFIAQYGTTVFPPNIQSVSATVY